MSKKDKNKEAEEPQVEDTATATAEQEQKEEKTAEEQLQDQLAAEKDKFMRLFAEFENYKKIKNLRFAKSITFQKHWQKSIFRFFDKTIYFLVEI